MSKRGRPKVPEEQKIVNQTIRLEPAVADAVCRYALRHHISVYALLGNVITKVFAKQVNSSSAGIGYYRPGQSVVAARPSSGVSSAALV